MPIPMCSGARDVYKRQREAFEQLIERQTCEHFEEWLEQREMAENAA